MLVCSEERLNVYGRGGSNHTTGAATILRGQQPYYGDSNNTTGASDEVFEGDFTAPYPRASTFLKSITPYPPPNVHNRSYEDKPVTAHIFKYLLLFINKAD